MALCQRTSNSNSQDLQILNFFLSLLPSSGPSVTRSCTPLWLRPSGPPVAVCCSPSCWPRPCSRPAAPFEGPARPGTPGVRSHLAPSGKLPVCEPEHKQSKSWLVNSRVLEMTDQLQNYLKLPFLLHITIKKHIIQYLSEGLKIERQKCFSTVN